MNINTCTKQQAFTYQHSCLHHELNVVVAQVAYSFVNQMQQIIV